MPRMSAASFTRRSISAFGQLAHLQAEGHVVVDVHVGIEGVGLEHHGDVPVLGGDVVDQPVADEDVPGGDLLQARHHAQGGGLAAARGAHQDQELLVLDLDGQVVHRGDVAELLGHMVERYVGHLSSKL